MKPLSSDYKTLLRKIAIQVQGDLAKRILDDRVIKIENLQVDRTDTFGYYVQLFRFRKIAGRGKIELWLDLWTNIGRPILCICFWSSDISKINIIVRSCIENYSDDHPTKLKYFSNGNLLEEPLLKQYFNKFLIEPYSTKYLSYYFFDEINLQKAIPTNFLKNISNIAEWLIRSTASALEIISNVDGEYSAIENREIVVEHKRRERSKELAEIVKRRDAFICRICDFNFVDYYGEIGRGFAEAHHIIALFKLKENVKTLPGDLITVCANCHRMLHRMEGKEDDYKKLGKLVQKHMANAQQKYCQ